MMEEPKNPDEASTTFAMLCRGNHPGACTNLGNIEDEKGASDRAALEFARACELGDSAGCTNLAFMYRHGKGVTQDVARAFGLNEKACAKHDPRACNNLGDMYETGDGVAADSEKAGQLYEQVCGAQDSPLVATCCAHLSGRDSTRRHAFGCYSLGMLLTKRGAGDEARVRKLFERACEGGVEKACPKGR